MIHNPLYIYISNSKLEVTGKALNRSKGIKCNKCFNKASKRAHCYARMKESKVVLKLHIIAPKVYIYIYIYIYI
jgi:hypothetical protein